MRKLFSISFALCYVVVSFAEMDIKLLSEDDTTAIRNYAPKLFLDCSYCYSDYLKDEIKFINYVRERTESDIHLLITLTWTSSGGVEYTLEFIGRNEFSDLHYTIKYDADGNATTDEIRKGLAKTIKMGLMPFLERTPLKDLIEIKYNISEQEKKTEVIDKWKNWVFSVKLSGYATGQSSSSYFSLNGNLSAKKITETDKITFFGYTNHSEDRYDIDGEIIKSVSHNYGLSGSYVKGLGEHFSAKVRASHWQEEYSNIKIGVSISAGIEYNIFPYSEYSKHEFVIRYFIPVSYQKYYEETIYEKTQETLFQEKLSCHLSIVREWGSTNISLSGSHYFHDFSLNHLSFYIATSIRLFSGFSFEASGGVSMVHDQISLRRSSATTEEILLQQRQLETQYSYWTTIGIRYTFGSIYTNIVNTRF